MENYKNTNRPESQSVKNDPSIPDYQQTTVKQNPSENLEIEDDSSELYPDDLNVLGTLNSYHPDDDEDEYEYEDSDEDDEEKEDDHGNDDEDNDEDMDDAPIEEDDDFEEKDDDYRERKEGDFL